MRSRKALRIVTVTVGLALLVGATVACQPPHPDSSWSIQQLVLADGREPREGKPVTISADGQSIAFTGPVGLDTLDEREPEVFVVDQRPRALQVLALDDPGEYPATNYVTRDVVLSGDGRVAVAVGYSDHIHERPARAARALSPDDCGNENIYPPQILRWSRPSRFSAFGAPELVTIYPVESAACLAAEDPIMDGWLGVRGDNDSYGPSVSDDGSTVVFVSTAANLGADSAPPTLMVRDGTGAPAVVTPENWEATVLEAQVSANGLHVAFVAQAEPSDAQVYVVSRPSVASPWSAPQMLSTAAGGGQSDTGGGPADGNRGVAISADGGRVAWTSDAVSFEAGVVPYDSTTRTLVVWDRLLGMTHVARHRQTEPVDNAAYPLSGEGTPRMTGDGKRIAMTSGATASSPPDLTSPILQNPSATFNWRLGDTATRAFAGQAGGRQVVVFVAKEGPYQGRVISAVVPDANQVAQWGL